MLGGGQWFLVLVVIFLFLQTVTRFLCHSLLLLLLLLQSGLLYYCLQVVRGWSKGGCHHQHYGDAFALPLRRSWATSSSDS